MRPAHGTPCVGCACFETYRSMRRSTQLGVKLGLGQGTKLISPWASKSLGVNGKPTLLTICKAPLLPPMVARMAA